MMRRTLHHVTLKQVTPAWLRLAAWVAGFKQSEISTGRKVISIHQRTSSFGVAFFRRLTINVCMLKVDMTQMLGVRGHLGWKPVALPSAGGTKRNLALELLSGCGMILRARLRTSPANERCHGPLSSRVHHSSVICCNVLNLSRALHV
jgi:hypothetical protein